MKRLEYDYKFGDKLMLINKQDFKLKTQFKGPNEISQMWINGMDTLQMLSTMNIRNILLINPYKINNNF